MDAGDSGLDAHGPQKTGRKTTLKRAHGLFREVNLSATQWLTVIFIVVFLTISIGWKIYLIL